ncbi:MAG: ATP-binding protein, partial [Byssovorax sp.]
MQRDWLTSLRTKLSVALLIVALVPLSMLALLNKKTTGAALTENANQALFAIASQTATRIDTFIETNLNAVRVESVLPGLARYMSLRPEARKSGGEDEAMAMATLLGLIRKDTVNIASYALLDLEGRNILDTYGMNIGQDESKNEYFRAALETGLPCVSSVIFSGTSPQLFFSSPVRDASRRAIGVMRVSYNAAVLQQIVIKQTNLAGERSFAILLDDHHIRLAHGRSSDLAFKSVTPLAPALLQQMLAARRLPDRPAAELSTNLVELERALSEARTRFSLARLDETSDGLDAVAQARLEHVPWTVAFVQPQQVFLAPSHAQTRDALILLFLIAAIVMMAAILMGRFLTRPLMHLAEAATALTNGKLDTTVEVRSRDELGTLARSFNQMARELRESFARLEKTNDELEDRVALRTAELSEAKTVADAANKAKSDFLAGMSHELRTPLNGILGYAQILKRSRRVTTEELREIEVIFQCGSHLLMLINDILDLAKIESQAMELHPSDFHLSSFLRSTVEICRVRAEQKGIELLDKRVPPLPTGVLADERRLRQVLINLLGNAVKFTEKGSVTFTALALPRGEEEPEGDGAEADGAPRAPGPRRTIRFEIADTGCGIRADQLEQIFLPFKQADAARPGVEGTGLGLAISQRIVNMMGSSIHVKSEPGKGSVFWFDLELRESSRWAESEGLRAQGIVVGYQGRRREVLIVDDQLENRAVLVKMLEPLGFVTTEAENGQEGL